MGAETAFLRQWHAAKKNTNAEPTQERPVGRFEHGVPESEIRRLIADLPKMFRIVDDSFFPLLEQFQTGEIEIEHFAQEIEILKGYVAEQLVQAKFPQALVNGAVALLDVPMVIITQMETNRRREQRPEVRFHQLSDEERDSVYFLSTWSQHVADYFIAFGEQEASALWSRTIYDAFIKQWLDYTKDAKDVIKKLYPKPSADLPDEDFEKKFNDDFARANDFRGYKQGIWGSVGMVLDLFENGYDVRWSDPHTDVIRKIDMIASHRERQEILAISCKTWANIDDHVFIQEPNDIERAPSHRQAELAKEWRSLSNGAAAFGRETDVSVQPMVAAVAARKQDQASGHLIFRRGLDKVPHSI